MNVELTLHPPASELNPLRTIDMGMFGKTWRIYLNRNFPTQRYIYDHCEIKSVYEPAASLTIAKELKEGDTFFDVGANCGWFSALASQFVGEAGKVVAFEPDADNFEYLLRNAPEAEAILAAVTDEPGTVELYQNLDNDGGHSLWPCALHPFNRLTRAAGEPVWAVKGVTLDEYAHLNPNVIKIDTEGAEGKVLAGADRVLSNHALRMVIAECHKGGLEALECSPEWIEALMTKHGFKIEKDDAEIGTWIFRR